MKAQLDERAGFKRHTKRPPGQGRGRRRRARANEHEHEHDQIRVGYQRYLAIQPTSSVNRKSLLFSWIGFFQVQGADRVN